MPTPDTWKSPDRWFLSRSGREWNLLDPAAAAIHWPDIAESLAKTCRFNGHCRGFYSVAEHSLRVAHLMPPELYAYGLLHDAAEAFTGDLIHPLKQIIRPVFEPIEHAIEAAIWKAAHMPEPTPEIAAEIKRCDLVMLATERRDLVCEPIRPWRVLDGIEPDAGKVEPLDHWAVARRIWIDAFNNNVQWPGRPRGEREVFKTPGSAPAPPTPPA